tara:strand:- start:260 stop:463 length:204 start_codon:yes stop_codon:yes gene_type:complete
MIVKTEMENKEDNDNSGRNTRKQSSNRTEPRDRYCWRGLVFGFIAIFVILVIVAICMVKLDQDEKQK